MKRTIKRMGILFLIFAVALLVYFFISRNRGDQDQTIYVAMGETSLPVVQAEMYGRRMNRMPGYRQEMDNTAACDSLTILPEDRALRLYIADTGNVVTGLRYEIRSVDRERLVERTTVDSMEQTEEGLQAVLPIQNLLAKEQEYLLRVELSTERYGAVYYYTRILWTEDTRIGSMIDLAADFSAKTFDYDQARDLVTYLETSDTEDNSSFGSTTIRSSFSQLTWGRLKMNPEGTAQITLKEMDGLMCCVQMDFLASRSGEEETRELYEVRENFTMKWNELRTYLMDYEREVNQIFEGRRSDYSGKRIMLGITNDDRVSAKRSPNGAAVAYRVNRDLWSYTQTDRSSQAVKIFSFRDTDQTDARSYDRRHDVKILSVSDEGDVEFLVYGYMNRGSREGNVGVLGYRYDASENALEELFFIPSTGAYETLEADLAQLVYRTQKDMMYLYLDHTVYGIDLKSRENLVVADALSEGSFAVSSDGNRIAWQDGGKLYDARMLHLMDLESGEKQDIQGGADEYVRVLGFVERDLVYGIAKDTDAWVINGRIRELPMYEVKIINDRMQEETSYEKNGYYVSNVRVEESRIHLNRVTKLSENQYVNTEEDTIVCNADVGPGPLDGIGWYASQDKGKLYFVQLAADIRSGRNVRLQVPEQVTFDENGLLELHSNYQVQGMRFYAYGSGVLKRVTMDFATAVQTAYDHMGYVTDQDHRILWSRVNRENQRSIREAAAAFAPAQHHLEEFTASRSYSDGVVMLDARGCSLPQVLYFVDQGIPVLAYTGENDYLLICGFDQYNVTVYDPDSGETWKVGLNDSTEYFRLRSNDFVCAVQFP